jgi:hypothetical protein
MSLIALTLLLSSAAFSGDVLQSEGYSGVINWTSMKILVTEEARGFGTGASTRAVEQLARQKVGPGILASARRIRVDNEKDLAALLEDPSLSDPIRSRIARWHVSESRYFASGKVALVGELSLLDALKPLVLREALPRPKGTVQPRYSGMIVDARGTGLAPSYLPVVRDHEGVVLYRANLWEDAVLARTPVVFVEDPADEASVRAGDSPFFVRAESADGTEIMLDKTESLRFKTAIQESYVLGEGRVVIVVGSND